MTGPGHGCPTVGRSTTRAVKETSLPPQNRLVALSRPTLLDAATPVADLTLNELLLELADPDTDVHDAAVTNIEAARVRQYVRMLPMMERKVIVLRFGLAGAALSCRQTAARLGLSPTSVSRTERWALDRLRRLYDDVPEAA